jgi:hypothetical protein
MAITEIDPSAIAGVCGGMNLDNVPLSPNVEDRRGMSLEDSLRAPTRPGPPLPPLIRRPGDLSSQAGLDDIK